ncbi:hypothetical protein FSP39_002569 [Pinctada imbricata]|uniref:non-specific serine/threonine protein kinase n=1 Tax=Pinctada imbricata TaxID=66713 RepID=A0AA88YH68_PINIB|nr:hypothetical protein FSP39_002569 [Pinctada imbricata]
MEEEEIWELEFEKILGNGSFGIVYLIRDSKDDRRYAVKRINFQGQESERKAAKKEADILSRVSHDSILNYIESFEDEECLNIVTEYCDGGDLEVYIKQREGKKLPEVRICHWIHQIASGLKYLHDNKILHRDLKTKNVFLMGDLSLKLGDLGIAKLLELNQSKAESFVGTPAYMSPELFKHLPYNHKSDIWSFGCCCYEMVALKKAFGSDEGLFALCKKVCSSERPAFPRAYSESLKSLVYSMLEEVPDCRPSATDVFTNPYIKRNLARSIYKSDSPERGSKEKKLTTQKSGIRSRPQSSARERRRQREEFRKSRTFSGEWKHIKQQIQLDKLEKKSVTKTVEKMRKLKLSSHKSESETTSDSCHSNDEDDSTFVNGGTTIIEKVRKYNSRTVGSYFDLEDPDSTLGSNESQGHNGFDLDPNVAAKQMVQNMRNNLTPFETVNTTQDEVFDTTETERATNQKVCIRRISILLVAF